MHGVVFEELRKFVNVRFGAPAWDELIAEAATSAKTFTPAFSPTRAYPDSELMLLLEASGRRAGLGAREMLEELGAFMAPDLLMTYRSVVKSSWRTLDVIEHTEETIHKVVRAQHAAAAPPYLRTKRTSPDTVVVRYGSPRRMCAMARGIIRGLASHFEEEIAVLESQCMLEGASECTLEVSRVQGV